MVYYITSFSHSWPSVFLCQTANTLLSMFVRPALNFCSFPPLCFILGLYWSYFTGVTGFKSSPFVSAILRHDRSALVLYESSHLEAAGSELTCVSVCAGSWCCCVALLLGSELFIELTFLCASSLGSRTCGEKSVDFPAHASFPRPNVNI